MNSVLLAGLTALLISIVVPGQASAQQKPGIEFDIFNVDDSLGVWLDLSDLISSRVISQLKEGVRFAVRADVALEKPRRLWGHRTVAASEYYLTVGYRSLTEDYEVKVADDDPALYRYIPSLAALHRYLADSVFISIGPLADLDPEIYYEIQIRVAVISLTKINVAFNSKTGPGVTSAIGFLFRGFLELTGFGQEELRLRSRPFTTSEILPPN